MEIKQILAELEYFTGVFPREALARAIEEREQIIPELLDIIESAADDPEALLEDDTYMAHIYSMFLLSQFREKRAYEPMVRLFSQPGELAFDVAGDVVTENLHSMLASVSCGDDTLIKTLIENPQANEYVRGAGMMSLVDLVAVGELTRDSVMQYFMSLYREKLEREPSFVWDCLASCCRDLYPQEVYEDIKQSFREGLADPMFVSPENVREQLEEGKEATLAQLRADHWHGLVQDTIAEMEWWACFKPKTRDGMKKKQKIGRNQPCPCGSGKKYKKCCGRPEDHLPLM